MNIQFVRLEDDVCGRINKEANEQRRTVSELVNEILRRHLLAAKRSPVDEKASQ